MLPGHRRRQNIRLPRIFKDGNYEEQRTFVQKSVNRVMGAGEGFSKGQSSRKFYFSRVSDRGTREEAEDPSDTWDAYYSSSLRLETYTQFWLA